MLSRPGCMLGCMLGLAGCMLSLPCCMLLRAAPSTLLLLEHKRKGWGKGVQGLALKQAGLHARLHVRLHARLHVRLHARLHAGLHAEGHAEGHAVGQLWHVRDRLINVNNLPSTDPCDGSG